MRGSRVPACHGGRAEGWGCPFPGGAGNPPQPAGLCAAGRAHSSKTSILTGSILHCLGWSCLPQHQSGLWPDPACPAPWRQGNVDRALWVQRGQVKLSFGTKPINTSPRFHGASWAGGRQLPGFLLLPNHFAYGTFGALCSEEERRRPRPHF